MNLVIIPLEKTGRSFRQQQKLKNSKRQILQALISQELNAETLMCL